MDCSTPGLSVPHHLPKFAQVHIHCIGDAIQPSHPLMPSSPPDLNLSQHRGLFPLVSCSHQMTKNTGVLVSASVLPMSEYSGLVSLKTGLISLLSKGLSGLFSSTTVGRHQFFSTSPSVQSSSHNRTWPVEFGKYGIKTRTQVLQSVSTLHCMLYYGVIILGASGVKAES